jgi:hypothetical protein
MNWVTWENIGVDRIGCAWLILRFIDPDAKFHFISGGQTRMPPDAEPFDIPGVRLSHRGSHCTFHTMLHEFNLTDPILKRIASIIDEADVTGSEVMVEPVAAGLDFICEGIRRISADDDIAIERGRLIYEALYAQLLSEKSI